MNLKKTLCRLALKNEAQHDAVYWDSKTQHQPTFSFFTSFLFLSFYKEAK
jgi:hypothetical protein